MTTDSSLGARSTLFFLGKGVGKGGGSSIRCSRYLVLPWEMHDTYDMIHLANEHNGTRPVARQRSNSLRMEAIAGNQGEAVVLEDVSWHRISTKI